MLNKGLVDVQELKRMKDKSTLRGKSGYCFIIGDKIIKIYGDKSDRNYFYLNRNEICDMNKFDSKLIIFPQEYLYENGIKCGEIQNYIKGKSLIEDGINEKVRLYPLINHYKKMIEEIKRFPDIYMYDLCSSNIFYSRSNGFHIIDTSEWQLKDNYTKENLYRFDMSVFDAICNIIDFPDFYHDFVNSPMFSNIFLGEISYGKIGEEFYEIIRSNLMRDFHIVEFIEAYQMMYQIYYNDEMKTLENMKNYTKILKKG